MSLAYNARLQRSIWSWDNSRELFAPDEPILKVSQLRIAGHSNDSDEKRHLRTLADQGGGSNPAMPPSIPDIDFAPATLPLHRKKIVKITVAVCLIQQKSDSFKYRFDYLKMFKIGQKFSLAHARTLLISGII